MYLAKNNWIILIILGVVITACDFTGIKDDTGEVIDSDDTLSGFVDYGDTTIEKKSSLLLPDTINGQKNEMVYQREDGLRIEWTVKKKDNQIQLNDVVLVNYKARVASGEQYDSNDEIGEPVPIKTNIGMLVKGWEEGLLHMHVGDKGRIMIPSDLGYGENGYMTIVPPEADLIIDIEIVERIDPIVLEEGVKVYKWKKVKDGAKPVKNQLITFDYFAYCTGKKAKMYDNSYQNGEPFSFKFENANVIDGLHQGMSVMKPGENAFIEIPSRLAYGRDGLLDHVPSNTDIVYDVRVLDIK